MKLRSILCTATIALSVVACGSGDGGGASATVPANSTVVTAVEGIAWDAKTYTGSVVDGKLALTLRNNSSLPHNLHLLDKDNVDVGVALDVKERSDVHSGSFALAPGSYTVICTIAGHGNMKATLTVT